MAEDVPSWLQHARDGWQWRGTARPPFATVPGPGQESVWDYPRPPLLVPDPREVRVLARGVALGRTRAAVRVLETSHPPTFYVPRDDVDMRALRAVGRGTFCEWKGECTYFDVIVGDAVLARAAWSYERPFAEAQSIAGHLGFYAHELECWVGNERARPQQGGFYGGWITSELVGPFKGEPGTTGW